MHRCTYEMKAQCKHDATSQGMYTVSIIHACFLSHDSTLGCMKWKPTTCTAHLSLWLVRISSQRCHVWLIDGLKVGCMGFCMGGALTLSISQSGKIDCGAPCYGLPSKGHGEVTQLFIAQGKLGPCHALMQQESFQNALSMKMALRQCCLAMCVFDGHAVHYQWASSKSGCK